MLSSRRHVLRWAGGVAAALTAAVPTVITTSCSPRPPPHPGPPARDRRPRAVLFDAFPIFDPRPIAALAETMFHGKGAELVKLWRTRQFEYTWLRAAGGRYADFWQVTEDALVHAARASNVTLTPERRAGLMNAHLSLRAWPDVPRALDALRSAGLRLGFLSNFTPAMLAANIEHAGLKGMFEHVLSADSARTYKPDPRAYQLGPDALGVPREEIVFVAFAGWDAAGATWFGYPTFWANRLGAPAEELGEAPLGTGAGLADLVSLVLGERSPRAPARLDP